MSAWDGEMPRKIPAKEFSEQLHSQAIKADTEYRNNRLLAIVSVLALFCLCSLLGYCSTVPTGEEWKYQKCIEQHGSWVIVAVGRGQHNRLLSEETCVMPQDKDLAKHLSDSIIADKPSK